MAATPSQRQARVRGARQGYDGLLAVPTRSAGGRAARHVPDAPSRGSAHTGSMLRVVEYARHLADHHERLMRDNANGDLQAPGRDPSHPAILSGFRAVSVRAVARSSMLALPLGNLAAVARSCCLA